MYLGHFKFSHLLPEAIKFHKARSSFNFSTKELKLTAKAYKILKSLSHKAVRKNQNHKTMYRKLMKISA